MRILHTADWHLGRILHGVHLTDDQAHVLEQLVALAREFRPDLVVIAGDVYDRAVPPQEAVALLDEVLTRLCGELRLPVVLTAGNHDSPERLAFGARLLAGQRLHVVGGIGPEPRPLRFEDRHGAVEVWALPFLDPLRVRHALDDEAVRDQPQALAAVLARVRAARDPARRSVLVAHAAVLGCETSESERPLAIGGAETVPASLLAGFDYVALGHLHRPQGVDGAAIRYAGSLLKYSFSEIGHEKSVTLVEMDGAGACRMEAVALAPRRDLRRIEGTLAELERGAAGDPRRDDYVVARLLDPGPVLDAMGRLRRVYPNVLHIERPILDAPAGEGLAASAPAGRLGDEALFAAFFEQVTGAPLDEAGRRLLAEVLEALERRRRGEEDAA
ncbi:exonuclease SbcCD subunit D [Inmirania thermothiophila]|uniref:Nuclease SbcCD subunit D n=1 Tax=Inmirania thermothiophila TaxID=1750597 RepID=A0A3N1Y1I8_9GAMM|nr:exonuclease SbcCD subunit D [Inmirania thermothiophila]ROR32694.1 exodeoxyribonuclease I subunit D [Inmirania thermothiophila]